MTNEIIEHIIEANLSEPHTSGTALCGCVCIRPCLRPYTINFKCTFKYFQKIEHPRAHAWQCWATVSCKAICKAGNCPGNLILVI